MTRNDYDTRYQALVMFDGVDRDYYGDSPEEKERKALARKAKYIVVIDPYADEYYVGGDPNVHGKVEKDAMIFRIRNVHGRLNNLLNLKDCCPLSKLNYDPCEQYREEYVKKYGGTIEDLEW